MSSLKNDYVRKPFFSVITICLNAEKTIEQTICSIIKARQKFDDMEYLVIDGGSTDSTLSIINKYSDNIDYFVSEQDKGISNAFNKGISQSNGKFISIISADDLLGAETLILVADASNKDSSLEVIYGDAVAENIETGVCKYLKPRKLSYSSFKYGTPLIHSSVFVKSEVYSCFGAFDEQYKYAMDVDFLYRVYKLGAVFHYISQPLTILRLGGVNEQNRYKTILEVRRITLTHGVDLKTANLYVAVKVLKHVIKQVLLLRQR